MQVKKYLGDNIQELLWQVKSELGEDAVIIHTRKFKEGAFLGFLGGQEKVEVIAATEGISRREKEYKEDKQIEKNLLSLEKQVEELKGFLEKLTISQSKQTEESQENAEVFSYLLQKNISTPIIAEIQQEMTNSSLTAQEVVSDYFERNISLEEFVQPKKPQVVALVGPTGVGKTTTIAKLTAQYTLLEGKNIALLTADTYRIAAVDQLKTYGQIMNVPVEAVYTPDELKEALEKYQEKDVIFLDTAGRNQKNAEQMEELQQFLSIPDDLNITLVLSATTKYEDLENIVQHFNQLNFTNFIFTKLDETESYGSMLSLLVSDRKPLVYIAKGQNVPDDLYRPTYDLLIKDLLEGLPQ